MPQPTMLTVSLVKEYANLWKAALENEVYEKLAICNLPQDTVKVRKYIKEQNPKQFLLQKLEENGFTSNPDWNRKVIEDLCNAWEDPHDPYGILQFKKIDLIKIVRDCSNKLKLSTAKLDSSQVSLLQGAISE